MEHIASNEKIAVIKILIDIMNADNIVHESEVAYIHDVLHAFCLTEENLSDAESLTTEQAFSIIKKLPQYQKEEVAKMLGKMIVVDQDINYNEVRIYNDFCEACDLGKAFDIDEYPGYTLSGPFVNPEDMMK